MEKENKIELEQNEVASDETAETNTVEEAELIALAQKEGLLETQDALNADESNEEESVSSLEDLYTEEEQEFIMAAAEAVLFMSDKPVSANKLKNTIRQDMKLSHFKKLLQKQIEAFNMNTRGVEIGYVNQGYQLRTKPLMSAVLRNMVKTQPLKLTSTAMETLAVIAYKQPITKDEIDRLRGVDSGYMIRNLMEKRMVKISGRSELPGRPMLYSTTHEFLELFNLRDSTALPPLHEIEAMIAASEVGAEDEEEQNLREFSEMVLSQKSVLFEEGGLDKEVEDIKSQIAAISTSTPFIEEQKRKEKIKIELSSNRLSDEKRSELEAELAALETAELQAMSLNEENTAAEELEVAQENTIAAEQASSESFEEDVTTDIEHDNNL